MKPVSYACDKIWKSSSAPAISSAEGLEATQISTRIIRSLYEGRNRPGGLVLSLGGHSTGLMTRPSQWPSLWVAGQRERPRSPALAIELEGQAYGRLRSSDDFREGVEAFHQKRRPKFTGR